MKSKIMLFLISVVLLGGFVVASTVISDNKITSGGDIIVPNDNYINFTSTQMGQAGTGPGNINFNLVNGESKGVIKWFDYYTDPANPKELGWFMCHKNLSNGEEHQHCGIETTDEGDTFVTTKFEVSHSIPENQSFVAVTSENAYFILHDGVEQWIGDKIVNRNPDSFNLYSNNQTTYGIRITNRSNMGALEGAGADEIGFNSDLNVYDNEILLDAPTTQDGYVKVNRVAVGDNEAGFRLSTADNAKWSFFLDDDGTDNLYVRAHNIPANIFILKTTGAVNQVPRVTAPSSPALGDTYVDSSTNAYCFYNSTSWVDLTGNGGACV